jgi:hypothetical protein
MKLKLYLGVFAAIFLFVMYFFISHAYVFVRLTTVMGFMLLVAFLVAVVAYFGRIFR